LQFTIDAGAVLDCVSMLLSNQQDVRRMDQHGGSSHALACGAMP
jgi:hypothetical protein